MTPAGPCWVVRGLAVWVTGGPEAEVDEASLGRAARLVLERALKFVPETEVYWYAPGTAPSAVEGAAADSSRPPAPVEVPPARGTRGAQTAGVGGTRLPPSAGPVSRMTVDLAARMVGREELQQFLGSFETAGASARAVDVYVGRIRRKLGNARHAVATVRGRGYQFVPGVYAAVRGPAEYCI